MRTASDSAVSVLFVEPHIFAQLELVHAAQAMCAPLSLSCVATCGGARDALANGSFDCLVLSTNLDYRDDERPLLASLIRDARSRGVLVMSFGVGELSGLGLPMLDRLESLYGGVRADREPAGRGSAFHLRP